MPKTMTVLDRAKLELTMHRFDFIRVHEVMNKVKWQWASLHGGLTVPSIDQLKDVAERLLEEAYQGNTEVSTGGFWANYDGHNFFLKFIVIDSDSYIDGDEEELENVSHKNVPNTSRKKPIRDAISSLEVGENKS